MDTIILAIDEDGSFVFGKLGVNMEVRAASVTPLKMLPTQHILRAFMRGVLACQCVALTPGCCLLSLGTVWLSQTCHRVW